jgi:hypothetical protein
MTAETRMVLTRAAPDDFATIFGRYLSANLVHKTVSSDTLKPMMIAVTKKSSTVYPLASFSGFPPKLDNLRTRLVA